MTKQSTTIPSELIARPQWVTWRYEDDPKRPDKPKKVPCNPKTGYRASTTDSATWGTHDEAVNAVQRYIHIGIGYVFSPDDPYCGIDLDDCIDANGIMATWAAEIVQSLASYTEISPSGTGVKIWVEGSIPAAVKQPYQTGAVEMYSQGRYFTATGQHLAGTPTTVTHANGSFDALYQFLRPTPLPSPVPTPRATAKIGVAARWAEQRMQRIEEQARDRTSQLHNRRLELGKLAGGIVVHGLISADEAEQRIYDAHPPSAHHMQERKAIRDGITTGIASPLKLPDFPTEQPLIFDANNVAHCPSCDTIVQQSKYPYPDYPERDPGWYCPKCRNPMVWPLEAYTPPLIDPVTGLSWPSADDRDTLVLMPGSSTAPTLAPDAVLPGELGANASSWLDEYIDYSRYWSPRSYDDFHEAVALWLLSTIAGRRVFIHFGSTRFTSLYIALCARTSIYSKSTTARIGIETLEAAGLSHLLAADDATPQAFIRALGQRVPEGFEGYSEEKQEHIRRKLAFAAQRGWFYDEFGQKVQSMMREGSTMADFRGHLRRFDDCPARYQYDTIGRGSDEVERPYLALLANLTPADLRPFAKKGATLWNDGFWARFAFVTPPRDAPRSMGQFPSGERLIPCSLIQPLCDWHERLGIPNVQIIERLKGSGEGGGVYDVHVDELVPQCCTLGDGVSEAFYRYHDGLLDAVQANENTDQDGSYARFAEKALRIAMLLASLENDRCIELAHFARAQQITERWRQNLYHLIEQLTDDEPTAERTMEDKIIALLKHNNRQMTIREIVRGIRNLSRTEAEKLLDRLATIGVVEVQASAQTKRYYLSASEKERCQHVNGVNVSTISKSVDTLHNVDCKPPDNEVSTDSSSVEAKMVLTPLTPDESSNSKHKNADRDVLTPVDTLASKPSTLSDTERLALVCEQVELGCFDAAEVTAKDIADKQPRHEATGLINEARIKHQEDQARAAIRDAHRQGTPFDLLEDQSGLWYACPKGSSIASHHVGFASQKEAETCLCTH